MRNLSATFTLRLPLVDAANQGRRHRQPLLQQIAIAVRRGLVHLAADFLHPAFDRRVLALALSQKGDVLAAWPCGDRRGPAPSPRTPAIDWAI